MGISGRAQGIENDRIGLNWIWEFGWLRSVELGKLLWPGNSHSTIYGCNLTKKWRDKGYVIERVLPENAGSAYVLASAGVELLAGYGISAKTGKDWGDTFDNKWIAPRWWKHDLLTSGVLTVLYERGFQIIPERKIRRANPDIKKIPDGIYGKRGFYTWLEVESHRKTSSHMDQMAKSLLAVDLGNAPELSGIKCSYSSIAFADNSTDERGHTLNHNLRVITALKKHAHSEVQNIQFLKMKMAGPTVKDIEREEIEIITNQVSEALKGIIWEEDNELGTISGMLNGSAITLTPVEDKWSWSATSQKYDNDNRSFAIKKVGSGKVNEIENGKLVAVTAVLRSIEKIEMKKPQFSEGYVDHTL
jgi:hypothetical protein